VIECAGIYIHIPFCERKCTYCNFNTTDFDREIVPGYVGAVVREIEYWGTVVRGRDGGDQTAQVDSIYFGGGTPSIIEADHIHSLIDACRTHFEVSQSAEITIEINPGSFARSKLENWLESGVNRASVGVQSFMDRELQALSRTHDTNVAVRTIESLREAGFDNISLDLIAGLPEQSLEDWRNNLRQAIEIGPEHLSLYLLEVKEGTQLFAQLKRGTRPLPDDDLAADMYELITDETRAASYEHYEISNFARSDDTGAGASPYRSKHNVKYWTGASFYGVGCGAHSYDGRKRWVNIKRTESYVAAVEATGSAIAETTNLSDRDRAAEALFMGLRLAEGIQLDYFNARYGVDVEATYRDDLARLEDAGLLESANRRLRLTRRGRLLSNEVFEAFV
jgi:putative oxygen-independent coproporphyrinogen III oxidase